MRTLASTIPLLNLTHHAPCTIAPNIGHGPRHNLLPHHDKTTLNQPAMTPFLRGRCTPQWRKSCNYLEKRVAKVASLSKNVAQKLQLF